MPQLLTSALVFIIDNKQKFIKCRVLLDTCASANFISETIVKRLGLPIIAHSSSVDTIGNTNTRTKGLVQITVRSMRDTFTKKLTCLIVPTISNFIPSDTFPRNSIEIPANIKLADPEFYLPRPIDLLIGSGPTLSLLSIGQIDLSQNGCDLYLQKTRLGWIVAGGLPEMNVSKNICHLSSIESQIAKFWEIEETAVNKLRSDEEIAYELHFTKNTMRDEDGRYKVRLPFRQASQQLGESRIIATRRLLALERKFDRNLSLKSEYTRVLDKYLNLKHMTLIEHPDDYGYYMPHHAVIKESSNTTKARVVFDASAKTSNGLSLNDVLMVGPNIQDKLFAHLLRFRTYKYVIIADIEKMYRQVRVHKDDRRFQRIL